MKLPSVFRSVVGFALLLGIAFTGCNTGNNGGPVEDPSSPSGKQPPPKESPADPAVKAGPDQALLQTYERLRQEILQGKFIALYDFASTEYRKVQFAPERFRPTIASLPGLKDLKLTAEDVTRMEARDLIVTYFKLLPQDQKKHLALAMASVKVLGTKNLPDGRKGIEIESNGVGSLLIWTLEGGEWKMAGEERGKVPEKTPQKNKSK
ncbi:MAG: hypothetical protein ACYTHM_16355 [Planctomycetota bacterium]|jgi:hypothetical protein